MPESVWVAVITGALAIIGDIIISARSTKDLYAKLDKQSELADERIKGEIAVIHTEINELRKTVERHNSVVERTYKLEERMSVAENQIKVASHRVDDLERAN